MPETTGYGKGSARIGCTGLPGSCYPHKYNTLGGEILAGTPRHLSKIEGEGKRIEDDLFAGSLRYTCVCGHD